jgi:hypothetical protein
MNYCFTFIMTITLISILVSFSLLSTNGQSSPNQALPDLSGIGWIDGDTFLAVHDAKYPSEAAEPRASLLSLPSQLGGTVITPLNITWPLGENPGSDLECVAKIPNTIQTQDSRLFLLGESGDNDRGSKRIFLSELNNNTLIVTDAIQWPTDIHNIEGCSVTAVDNELIFIFAERAHGSRTTNIKWATLSLDPLQFGPVNSLEYRVPGEQQTDFRPVSALEIDDTGKIFISSAIDPNDDAGPFSSEVWLVGYISSPQNSTSSPILLLDSPERLASLDGLKVEGLATRPAGNGSNTEIIIGTDDEFNGGVLRILPPTLGTE